MVGKVRPDWEQVLDHSRRCKAPTPEAALAEPWKTVGSLALQIFSTRQAVSTV